MTYLICVIVIFVFLNIFLSKKMGATYMRQVAVGGCSQPQGKWTARVSNCELYEFHEIRSASQE